MKKILLLSLIFFSITSLEAGYSPYFKEWKAGRYAPEYSAHEHYDHASLFFAKKEWKAALPHFMAIVKHFPDSDFYTDSLYFTAICHYFTAELDQADRYFTTYLESRGNLRYYEKALAFKFYIAEHYANGRKVHLFKRKFMPTGFGTLDKAVAVYDEVIASLTDHDLAIRALYGKAQVLFRQRNYNESVETFKSLIHRYEVHELAEMSLLHISEIYLERAQGESQNPDLLALAELNLRSFRSRFPSSPKIAEAEQNFAAMQEIFGESLLNTARFYERKGKPKAAKIYLDELLVKYPHSEVAKQNLS